MRDVHHAECVRLRRARLSWSECADDGRARHDARACTGADVCVVHGHGDGACVDDDLTANE